MNHNRERPKVFNFRDDVGCKLNTVVALKNNGCRGIGCRLEKGSGCRLEKGSGCRDLGVGQWV